MGRGAEAGDGGVLTGFARGAPFAVIKTAATPFHSFFEHWNPLRVSICHHDLNHVLAFLFFTTLEIKLLEIFITQFNIYSSDIFLQVFYFTSARNG